MKDFKIINNLKGIEPDSMQVSGQCESVEKFVQSLNLKTEWEPYGYRLRYVLKYNEGKSMTAYLYN